MSLVAISRGVLLLCAGLSSLRCGPDSASRVRGVRVELPNSPVDKCASKGTYVESSLLPVPDPQNPSSNGEAYLSVGLRDLGEAKATIAYGFFIADNLGAEVFNCVSSVVMAKQRIRFLRQILRTETNPVRRRSLPAAIAAAVRSLRMARKSKASVLVALTIEPGGRQRLVRAAQSLRRLPQVGVVEIGPLQVPGSRLVPNLVEKARATVAPNRQP